MSTADLNNSTKCASTESVPLTDVQNAVRSPKLSELGLFAGLGGLSEGLEDAGFCYPKAFCEIDQHCQGVLQRKWPTAKIHHDVCDLEPDDVGPVDVISAGFPCQDISFAGFGAGLDGDRSGLWFEVPRFIRALKPRYVVLENVRALLVRGLDRVLRDLAALGYDAEWSVVSACSLGLTHVRPRMFILAYPHGQHGREGVWNTAARSKWALQAQHRFEGTRARQRARLEDPSELYRGADGLRDGPQRNRAIGNAVAPIMGELIGRAILAQASQEAA